MVGLVQPMNDYFLRMKFVKIFKEIDKKDVKIAGGKGASLGEMGGAGIPIPPGFVITTATFEKFLNDNYITEEIDSQIDKVNHEDMETVNHASEVIHSLIIKCQIPQEVEKEINHHFEELKSEFVAVRSSATAEDAGAASWAGELESFLNTTKRTLPENIKRCWASLYTPRAIFYRFEKKLHKQKVSVAVVVQKMIQAEISGVAFSVNPVTQDKNQLVIEAGWGLGEAVVQGTITPDNYIVNKSDFSLIEINVNDQEKGFYRKVSEGNYWKVIPADKKDTQKLAGPKIIELAKLVINIEKHYGFPVDVEWVYEGGKFYITQSRPITTL